MPARSMNFTAATALIASGILSASASAAFAQAGPAPAPGGNLTMLASSDVDYLDPGRTYYTFGEMVTLATNRPLYSFKPGDALHPSRTWRPPTRRSPPIGRPSRSRSSRGSGTRRR